MPVPKGGGHEMKRAVLCYAASLAVLALMSPASLPEAYAQCPTTLSVTITSSPYLLVDSNKPGIQGPMVATISAVIQNTGGSAATDVYAYIGDGTSPGTFTAGSDPPHRLLMTGDTSDSTRYIGDLAPGQSKTVFWQVSYPMTYSKTYPFTVWVDNEEDCSAQDNFTFTTRSSLTASANKLLGSFTLSPAGGIVHPGNIVTVTGTGFNLGQVGEGPNNEEDAWLQPVGNLNFDPSCFRLVRTEAYIQSLSPSVYVNQLYFSNIKSQNPPPNYQYNSTDYVKYYFIALRPCSTVVKPYQEVASGQEEKYSGDYGKTAATATLTGASGGLQMNKVVSPTIAMAGGTLTWTISYGNTTSYPIGDPASGNGLVIIDQSIPANTTYVAGSAASSRPATVFFSTDGGSTWTTTEPPASQVTTIKWHIDEAIPANTNPAGTVSFQSVVAGGTSPGTNICNTALASVGGTTVLATASVCANVGTPQVAATKSDSVLVDADSNGEPSPGDTIQYTVLVGNNGTEVARNVVFTDTPGADTSLVVGSVDISGCTACLVTRGNDPGDSAVAVNIGDLAPQRSVTIYFNVLVSNTACDEVSNQGWVNGSNFSSLRTDDPDTVTPADPTVTTLTIPAAILNINKTGPEEAVVDTTITYTGTLSNTGNNTAYNVVLTDSLPNDLTFVGSSHTAIYDSQNNTVTWQLGDVPPGASIPGWLNAHISSSVADDTDLVNTFSLTWDDCAGSPAGSTEAQWHTTARTHPLLTIDKTGPEHSYPEGVLNYTIRIEQVGGLTAEEVTLTDTLPVGLSYVSSNPLGSCVSGVVTWDLGTLETGGVILVSLTVQVDSDVPDGTTLTDDAEVTWRDELDFHGPISDSQDTVVHTNPEITITKLGPDSAAGGSTITYTGTLSNVSSSTAYNVVLTDELPAGLTFVSSSHSAVYNPADNTVTWQLGDLPAGTSIPGWLTVYISPSVPEDSVLTNTFSVEWEDSDSHAYGPETATWATVVHESNFEIVKSGPETASPGDTIEYTVQVTNLGTCDEVTNVVVTDLLPYALTYVSSNPDGSEQDGTITWSLGSIAVGETIEITIQAEVNDGTENGTRLTNTAVVNWQYPGGGRQMSATWDTTIYTQPRLTINKTGPGTARPEDTLDYTIEVCNTGGSDALNVVLTDFLPAGMSYLGSSSSGSHDSGVVTWNLEPMAPDTCQSVSLEVTVDPGVTDGTILKNTAEAIWEDETSHKYGPASTLLDTTVHSNPFLKITKTGPPSAYQGEEVTYSIEVCNIGGDDALTVTLTDMLPIGLQYLGSDPEGNYDPDTYGEGIVIWDLDTLAPDDCVSVSVTAAVDYGLPDGSLLSDVASVTWQDSEGESYGPVASIADTRIDHAATLTKTGHPDPASDGETITYNLNYENVGTTTLTGVAITEAYDPFVSFVSATPPPDSGTNDHWTIGQLNPGESGTIEITVRVISYTPDQTVIRNKGYLTADQPLREEADQKTTAIASQGPNPPPPDGGSTPVGGVITPTNKVRLLAPWLGIAALATTLVFVLLRRRRKI